MEIGQARNFLAIAAHGSFLEAAKRLHITQSSVSARIQNLEDELGARLFERNRAGASLRVGRRIALWEELLPAWVSWMRQTAPGISIRSEVGFEEDLMWRLIEGTLDIGLMYTPSRAPGLVVEHLFDETLVMVSSHPETQWPGDGGFEAQAH